MRSTFDDPSVPHPAGSVDPARDVRLMEDEVILADADGGVYTYEVFKKTFVGPTDLSVTEPVRGRDIVTLQTCTLPDYSQRLVVQAEKAA